MRILKDVGEGEIFQYGKLKWAKLNDTKDGVLAVAEDVLPELRIFDKNSNNYKHSSIRQWLNNDFLKTLINNGAKEEDFLLFERDLIADDRMKDYGKCKDRISLMTSKECYEYRYNIPDTKNGWWLTTPFSCLDEHYNDVLVVEYDNDIFVVSYTHNININYPYYNSDLCYERNYVRPLCNFKSETLIQEVVKDYDSWKRAATKEFVQYLKKELSDNFKERNRHQN